MSVSSGGPFNTRAKMGAGFVGGGPSPILNPRKMSLHNYSGSPLRSADSMFSIYTGAARYDDAFDYEGSTFEEEEGEEMLDDDVIIELARLAVERAKNSLGSLSEELIDDKDEDEEDKKEVPEASGAGAIAGYTGPLKAPDMTSAQWRDEMDPWK